MILGQTTTEPTESPELAERHATNLELFLDLVFVFAITQVASFISHHPGGTGVAKGALLAFLVWWQWSQFTWAGSAINLQQVAVTRVLALCLMPVTLLMTIALPEAFDHDAVFASATEVGLNRGTALAIVVSVGLACVLWWTYFAYIPDVVERALRQASVAQRGVLARDLFSFGHFPRAFGLVLYAVVVKHLVPHPYGHLASDDRWLLASSVAAFVGGLLLLRLRISGKVAWPRLVAVVAVAVLCLAGGHLPGLAVVGGVAVIIGVMQAFSVHRYQAANFPIAS